MSKTQEKESQQEKILEFFLPHTLKITFWIDNLTQRWTQSGPFSPKSGHFFRFSKRTVEASSLPCSWAPVSVAEYASVSPLHCSWASVSVAEYASISLYMSKYFWECLNKLFWLCHGSEYAWTSYMVDRLLKMRRVLNKPGPEYGMYICPVYAMVTQSSDYLSLHVSNT